MNSQIIATIGPKSEDYKTLKSLARAGMNIARINFSHATDKQWKKIRSSFLKIEKETGIRVKMMLDLQGPRIRVEKLEHSVRIVRGETYAFLFGKADLEKNEIPIDSPDLCNDVKIGEPFYLANGAIELEISEIKNQKIFAKAYRGGMLFSRKAINIPQTNLSQSALTKKDIIDARFGALNGADYLCLSFVQSEKDIFALKDILTNKKPLIIAKIERALALKNIDEIIKHADGIMVARGDLGIEVPIEEVPIIQKELIRRAHWHKKPAIVATEMLSSMIDRPHPTRAEVTDIANAVFDGSDAVMLSDETAMGNYPIEAVEIMKKITERADEYFNGINYLEKNKF
ncbi:MAG: pyruvate kinase [Candidatus Paceibacterota bacterium]